MVIPGPKSPGKNLDVFLLPLIDELNVLWNEEVQTYDVSTQVNFQMRATLLWTINDFHAYGMVSGWSTHGRLSCPYCMERTKSFRLRNGHKFSWFDCHRQFLHRRHAYRRQQDKFSKGRTDVDSPPPYFSGEQIWERVSHLSNPVYDKFGNARKDIELYCDRPELHIFYDHNSKPWKPKASYTLDKQQIQNVFEWTKQLKFPDGYASNIARCVNEKERRLYGVKSHDCHIFMQRLLPIAFRDILPKSVWEAISELSVFFKGLCSTVLYKDHVEQLEKNIVEILCKLEKIFPPAFFGCMEHLPVHLAYEAKVGGPLQYRWMYPFER